jgi:hypothetical protein
VGAKWNGVLETDVVDVVLVMTVLLDEVVLDLVLVVEMDELLSTVDTLKLFNMLTIQAPAVVAKTVMYVSWDSPSSPRAQIGSVDRQYECSLFEKRLRSASCVSERGYSPSSTAPVPRL